MESNSTNLQQEQIIEPIPQQEMVTPIPKQKTGMLLLVTIVLLAGLAAGMMSLNSTADIRSKATNNGPTLALSPASVSKAVGNTVAVGILLNTNTDTVSAAQLSLSYDPTAIQIMSVTQGTPLPVILVPETHANGGISLTVGVQPATPFKGSGIIGTVNVKILAAKQSTLTFTSATQVAAIGKTTNALVSATGSTIIGTVAGTPTLTPTRIPGTTATPTPTRQPTSTPTPTRIPGTTNSPTPTRIPGTTNSPTPTRMSGAIASPTATTAQQVPKSTGILKAETQQVGMLEEDSTSEQKNTTTPSDTEDYSPFASTQPEAVKQTVFSQILSSVLEFFNTLFRR